MTQLGSSLSKLSLNLSSSGEDPDGSPLNSTLGTSSTSVPSPTASQPDCLDWKDAQHLLYQLANLCIGVSFLIPTSFTYHILCLRGLLALGSLFVLIWGASQVCHPDVLAWYLVFLLVNSCQLAYAAYSSWPVPLRPELEDLYSRTFGPLKVSRTQFRDLVGSAVIKDLPNGATYALEGATHCGEKLSILLSGRLKVSCEGIFLHHIEPNQFVDSPEYEAVPPGGEEEDNFQVSIRATEDSRLLTWPARTIHQYLRSRPFICSVFSTLLGKDITHKLYQVQEMLLSNPEYVRVLSMRSAAVHLRQRLSQTYAAGRPNLNGILCQMSSVDVPYMEPSVTGASSSPPHRVPTPDGPYSPSQVSFETCV